MYPAAFSVAVFWKRQGLRMRSRRIPPVTVTLIAINVIVFLLETLAGGSQNNMVALAFGAQYTPLVMEGQWWRLFTAMFIHFGIEHLGSNMITLWFFGESVERILGKWKMLILYLFSGLAGNLLTLVTELASGNYSLAAGASGAIFGLVGVYVAIAMIPELRRFVSVRNIVIMLVVNIAYGVSNRSINLTAHIGGLITGTIMAYIMLRSRIAKQKRMRV